MTCLARSDHCRRDGANLSTAVKGGKCPKFLSAAVPISHRTLSHFPADRGLLDQAIAEPERLSQAGGESAELCRKVCQSKIAH